MKYAEEARHPARHAVARAHAGAAATGCSTATPNWVSWQAGTSSGTACKRFFDWLETQGLQDAHPRAAVEVPRYTPCHACGGARLKPEALLWRLGTQRRRATPCWRRSSASCRAASAWSDEALAALPGLTVHDLMLLPIERARDVLRRARAARRRSTRRPTCCSTRSARGCSYLCDVGLGYLTLDRQSRTLSGGEVQRINLTTALGTSLVNTLFVLDEPSHRPASARHGPRHRGDAAPARRRQLAGRGRARPADHARGRPHPRHGPGPGRARRRRSCSTARPPSCCATPTRSPAHYLAARASTSACGSTRAATDASTPRARSRRRARAQPEEHRRRDSAAIASSASPASRARASRRWSRTCCTPALLRALRQADRDAGRASTRCSAPSSIDDVVLVDQSPIGRTDALEPGELRRRVRRDPQALRRPRRSRRSAATRAGTFSFNSGNGRCPTCGGNGFEHVEMQFLSDVYLRCPDCDGKRYRAEILEVQVAARRARAEVDRRRARPDGHARRSQFFARRPRGARARCSRSSTSASTT